MNGRSGKLRRHVACWLLLIVLPACDSKIDVDAHRRGSANHAMIAVANPLAAKAGFDVLQDGGSAVDAAIAAELVLTLVEPQSSGIGGGAFLVHLDGRQGRVETFDGRETAPASAAPDMFIGSDGKPLPWHITADLGRAVGIPGLLRMFESAHRAHGILPWARLFAPAINLAQDGFIVSPRLAKLLTQEKRLREIPGTSDYFFPGGEALKAGDTLKNPRLAATLKSVATLGASSFYSGEIAAEISARVATARNGATKITPQDLGGYRAPERPPVCVPYRQYKVCGMGPPSSGGILIAQMLGILSHFDLPSMAPYSPEAVHLIVEASRLAFADRNLYVADADMVPVPIDKLIDPAYLAERARLIDTAARIPKVSAGRIGRQATLLAPETLAVGGTSTTHMSVVDRFGNAVSMTASIERPFGTGLMAAGFLLNNQLTDFSFTPKKDGRPVANAVAPGKRPRSTMSPTLVFGPDGELRLAIGSPGGSRIAGYTLKVILGVLDWNLHIADAIARPNIVCRGGPVDIEADTHATALKPALETLGHTVEIRPLTSGLHGIEVRDGRLYGGADPRREGIVLGD